MENIDLLKKSIKSQLPTYKLSRANVFISPGGLHYIDYLDKVEKISSTIDYTTLTKKEEEYISKNLQHNSARFFNQVKLVSQYVQPKENKKVLDVGCGGGLFLSLLNDQGYDVKGIELNNDRAAYATQKYKLNVSKVPVESEFWQKSHNGYFDAITLWDVFEHVNYPVLTISSIVNLLRPGGVLLLDTPCKDGFYYRFGELTYSITRGKYPTLLNAMYSSHMFGHKQIFSTTEMAELFETEGLVEINIKKIHELSFPYEFYLKNILKSDFLTQLSLPFVKAFFSIIKIKNKMVVVGVKNSS